MIYTFYSFKGGAGRSMALANVAKWFYLQGLRVVIIDWDLEAPGLENFFFPSEKDLEFVRSHLGLIDILMAYKRRFPYLSMSSHEVGEEERLTILQKHLPPISDTLYPIHPEEHSEGRALWLLPAGLRSGDYFSTYSQIVQSFDWNDFYQSFWGET